MAQKDNLETAFQTVGADIRTLQATSVTPEAAGAVASGSTLGLQQGLLAAAGQPALTVLAVGYTTSGKVQGVSLGAGNTVFVYASGADFTANTPLYGPEFMNYGEPICFTRVPVGAIITSTQGFYGFSEQVDGSDESPMPLLSYGLSFKETFMYCFRNGQTYNPTGTSTNQGWVHIVNGPIASTLKFTNGAGVTVQGQENIELDPWEYRRLYTSGNQEYIISSTNPVMACHSAQMDSNPVGRFYDSRLIMPLSNDLISWPRSGDFSTPYQNVLTRYYVRDGAQGTFTTSAGSPTAIDAATGATDTDYEPNGATRTLITGLGCWYSGADSAGLEASPAMPVSAMSQVVAQPLFIADTGDGGDSGVAIASPYEGEAKVWEYNTTTGNLDLAYTVPLLRNGVTVTTPEDQLHPSAGLVANESSTGSVTLNGALLAGIVTADVPITVVVQNGTPTYVPTIRSQNGTTTTAIVTQDDETLSLGWTPAHLKAEITTGTDGLLYKRKIAPNGVETWELA